MTPPPEHAAAGMLKQHHHNADNGEVGEEEHYDYEEEEAGEYYYEEEGGEYYEEEEEDGDEDDEDDEEAEGLRVRALPVDGAPDYDAGPPVDGLEYLRRVRHEAAAVPDVMISTTLDPRAFDHKQTKYVPPAAAYVPPVTPPHAAPNHQWRREFLASFSDVRGAVSRAVARRGTCTVGGGGGGGGGSVPAAGRSLTEASEAALASFRRLDDDEEDEGEDGGEDEDEDVDVDEDDEGFSPFPLLSQLLSVDEVTAAALLRRHGLAMEEDLDAQERASGDGAATGGGGASETTTRAKTTTAGAAAGAVKEARVGRGGAGRTARMMRRRAAWFYALSARVGLPLDAETSAAVRAAARGVARARARTVDANDPSLPHLQVCLAVAGKYFGQGEPDDV